jgi:UDP-galactopyranose mutase
VQINYPDTSVPYTRTVEIKHVTGQQHEHTVISTEYPRAQGEPYYPVPSAQHRRLVQSYLELAQEEQRRDRVYFAGRLARYTYINTDEAVQSGLDTFAAIAATQPDTEPT